MPQYIVVRVSEVPEVDRQATGDIVRISAPDEPAALAKAATLLQEGSTVPVVYAWTLASNFTRKTIKATPGYEVAD